MAAPNTPVEAPRLQALRLSPGHAGSKTGTLLSLDVHTAAMLRDNDVIFTPTINITDEDSTRGGPVEFKRRGYQRPADPFRIKKICDYYRLGDLLRYTTPIIASVRKGFSSEALVALLNKAIDGDAGAVQALKMVLAIIDGQHRFEGAIQAAKRARDKGEEFHLEVLFLLIHDLSYDEETELFNVINTTPKRLPKALVEWNKYGITADGTKSREQDIRHIAVTLATETDSVWYEQVNLTGTGREPGRPVTLEGLRRSTDNMLKAGGLKHLKIERQIEMVKEFWAAVAETFPDEWNDVQPMVDVDGEVVAAGTEVEVDGKKVKVPKVDYRIKDLVGVASLAKLGGDILAESLGNIEPVEYIHAEVEKIAEVDWTKGGDNPWTSGQAGFAGQKGLYEALAYLRANGVAPWDDGVEMDNSDADADADTDAEA